MAEIRQKDSSYPCLYREAPRISKAFGVLPEDLVLGGHSRLRMHGKLRSAYPFPFKSKR